MATSNGGGEVADGRPRFLVICAISRGLVINDLIFISKPQPAFAKLRRGKLGTNQRIDLKDALH